MNKAKRIVSLVAVVIFFAAFQVNTKGYLLFAPPLIEQEVIDQRFELQKYQMGNIEDMDVSEKEIKASIIDSLLAQKALAEKAREENLEINEKELEKRMERAMEQAREHKDEKYGIGDYLEAKDLTIDEFFNQHVKEQIRAQLLVDQLHEKWMEETEKSGAFNELEKKRREIIESFKQKHQEEIQEIRKRNL
ncbi:hypothetical protein GWK91_03355 [Virgibacillus sp. MSP4-1]|uniref:hypothetical protein n=1 Tax=Virgibacillus sp. MSP4-1 TaxID=2700081 RepID=UPI0003A4D88B|nr:hypothetical protein [Virgibacillus sp. MSP4-1]QHS22040.1 hypothetical protein GWK91_03355 [Virgibacillus sp. MSP4-1]